VTCSLPAALLLVGWWKNGRLRPGDVLPLLPFFALGAAGGLVTAWVEKHHVGAQGAEWSFTFLERCLIAGRALWFYAGKLAWPAALTFVYPRWNIGTGVWWQWLYPAAAAGVLAGLWLARHRIGRGPLVAALFFAGTLGPALGFINVFPMRYSFVADHFQYLAMVGLIALAAGGLARLPRAVPALLVVGLGVLTWRQAVIYRNPETLWRHTLAGNPEAFLARNNLGVLLIRQGQVETGLEHCRQAIRINPTNSEARANLAIGLACKGQWDEVLANFHRAAQVNPNDFKAQYNLGITLAARGRLDEAIKAYFQALQIKPDFPDAWNKLGAALASQGRLEVAIESYQRALQLNPNHSEALDNLGNALTARNRIEEAIELYRRAILLRPDHAETFFHLGMAFGQSGRRQEAAASYREALRLNPDLVGALNNLAWVLATSPESDLRDGPEAVRLAERACELTQRHEPWFIGTLAAAYAEAGRYPEAAALAEKAEQLAASAGLAALAEKNHQLLNVYQAGNPYRESAP
jgi:protein O-mannosyl-transferase